MKHLMILNTLPFLPTYNENHIVKWEGGAEDSNLPFVILTRDNNKLTYTPDKIYHFKIGNFILESYESFISVEDVPYNTLKMEDTICFETFGYLYFPKYYTNNQSLCAFPFNNFAVFNNGQYSFTIKSDSIDVKLKRNDNLITTLTLTGLKRKDSATRDFGGEIASYQDNLIKVDRTNSDNPTVQFLYFNNSQYKDNYEREERMKLAFNPFDML